MKQFIYVLVCKDATIFDIMWFQKWNKIRSTIELAKIHQFWLIQSMNKIVDSFVQVFKDAIGFDECIL
jgi:hypothetical protein